MLIDGWLRPGLRARLLLPSLAVAVVAVVATAWVTERATSDRFRDALADEEYTEDFIREDLTLFAATHTDWRGVEALLASLAFEFDQRLALTTTEGSLIADTAPLEGGAPATLPDSATELIDPANPLFGFNPCGDDGFGGGGPVVVELFIDDEFGGELREFECVSDPAEPALLFLGIGDSGGGLSLPSGADLRVVVAVSAILAAAAIVTSLGARRILKPVSELTEAARRMEDGSLEERVASVGDDELGRLGHAFNSMAAALQRSDAERRTLTGDIAHELRTPLANIRGYLEGIDDGVVEPSAEVLALVHSEALLLQQLVDDLQTLTLAEAGQLRLHREPLDLAALAQQVVTTHRAQAESAGVRLDVRAAAVPPLSLDPARMRQVLGNLIQNALRHTPEGGEVSVSVVQAGGAVEVVVADSGEGIEAQHLPHVFDRFYRADGSRSRATGGTGLGLAIVEQLVETQGGEASIGSTVGAGTTVTIRFPENGSTVP